MAELQEKISKRFPGATFEEGETLLINIADSSLHDLVKALRDEHGFDYLVTIVGFDRTTALGCVYYLASTKHATARVGVGTDHRPRQPHAPQYRRPVSGGWSLRA